MGPELMARFEKHAQRFETEVIFDHVNRVDLSQRPLRLEGDSGEYTCDALIIATGASARYLGLPSEQAYMGKGVSACATCDGAFFRGEEIAIVGGGDTAMEEATFLTKFAKKVNVVHRRDQLRASKIMQERAERNPKISFIWNSTLEEIYGDSKAGGVKGVKLKNLKSGVTEDFKIDGVFIAIGHEPNSKLFAGQLEFDQNGYIKTHDGTKTNVAGVFACGDVQDHVYRQAVTAAGTGCMAAIDAERFLESQAH